MVELVLTGPKGHFTLGSVTHLAGDRETQVNGDGSDLVELRFRSRDDLDRHDDTHGDLTEFLQRHLDTVQEKVTHA